MNVHPRWRNAALPVALSCALIVLSACRPRGGDASPCTLPQTTGQELGSDAIEPPATALAQQLRQRIADAMETTGPITLVIRQEELAAALVEALGDSPPSAPSVRVTESAVFLGATIAGRDVVASFVPAASSGKLSATVACLSVDDHQVPRIAGAAAESVLDALAADAAWSVEVTDIRLTDGALSVSLDSR